MASTPDILLTGTKGDDGAKGLAAAPAAVDYAGNPAASGSCDDGDCVCAASGLSAGPGNPGNKGADGKAGQPAPTFALIVGRMLSDLMVQSNGGNGGGGGPGSDGTNGGTGQDAGTNLAQCTKKPFWPWESAPCPHPAIGGTGGDAGRGGDGGNGNGGGNGGDIYVYYTEPEYVSPGGAVYQVLPASAGGTVGIGGNPGQPGQPGPGGANELGNPANASAGNPNQRGNYGRNGITPGQPGKVIVYNVPAATV